MTSRKASQKAHLQHAGGLFDALFQAALQEFIEVLVQLLLCRGQFLFSLFCPGFVIGQFLFGHLDHFVQLCRLGAAFDFSVSYNGSRVFGMVPFFFCHGEAAWEIGVTYGDFGVNGLCVFIGKLSTLPSAFGYHDPQYHRCSADCRHCADTKLCGCHPGSCQQITEQAEHTAS